MLKKRSNLVPNIYDDRKPYNFRFLILKLIEEIFVGVAQLDQASYFYI